MKLFLTCFAILSISVLVGSRPSFKRADETNKQLSSWTSILSTIKDFIIKIKQPISHSRTARDAYTNLFRSSIDASLDSKDKYDLGNLSNKLSAILAFLKKKSARSVRSTLLEADSMIATLNSNDKEQLVNLANKLQIIMNFVSNLKKQNNRITRSVISVDFEKLPPFLNITFSEEAFSEVVRVYGYLNNLQKNGIKFV